jgi:ligand-binding SRPBCC domain-containing protein
VGITSTREVISAASVTAIRVETSIFASPEICFDLARDVAAHARSAAFSAERVISPGRTSGHLELGDLVTFEGKHFGIRQRFTARITALDRPRRFVDEMAIGPFKWLRHTHDFNAVPTGTLMIDVLEWQAPLGALGKVADALFLKRHMRWFVTSKQRHLKQIAEAIAGSR